MLLSGNDDGGITPPSSPLTIRNKKTAKTDGD